MEGFLNSFAPILQKYRIEAILIGIALIITMVSGLIYALGTNPPQQSVVPSLIKRTLDPTVKNILVDLSGSVEKPDVYEVSSGARLKDVLILAGGLSFDADRDFFAKNFNLARILQDQEKVYIPNQEETLAGTITSTNLSVLPENSDTLGASEKVSINSGTVHQLDTLPGVGEVTAQKVIQNRPYQSIEELLSKKVVGKSLFEKIKDLITL